MMEPEEVTIAEMLQSEADAVNAGWTEERLLFEAGHKVNFDNFSLIPYLLGEVRHNFHLNQRENAKAPTLDTQRRNTVPVDRVRVYFIVEQLARMEVALNYLAANKRTQNQVALDAPQGDDAVSQTLSTSGPDTEVHQADNL